MTEYTLHLLTPPTTEPVTVDEALVQSHADAGVEDAWFASRITAGRQKVETYVKLSLMPQTWVLRIDGDIPIKVDLPRSPVRELVSVEYNGEAIYGAVLINEGNPARVLLPGGYSNGAVRIEYNAGYETPERIPQPLKDAILLYVSHSYENRAGEADVPKAFYDLIEPYRLHTWIDRAG